MFEGRHYQNAYVTRNVEKAMAAFTARADVRSAFTFEASSEVMTAHGPGPHNIKLGFVWVGDLQYEFLEPIAEAAPMLVPWLPEGDEVRFHHTCARVSDWDKFRAQVDQQPFPVVIEGDTGGLKFLFLDARDQLGHYLEYTWMTDERWAQLGGR